MSRKISLAFIYVIALVVSLPTFADRPTTLVREEIPDHFKWDLTQVYPNWKTWAADLDAVRLKITAFSTFRGTLAKGADDLATALSARGEMLAAAEKVWGFAYLHWVEDTRQQDAQKRLDLGKGLVSDAQAAASWLDPELIAIPHEKIASWINTSKALKPYAFILDEVYRLRTHALDADGEQLLSLYTPVNTSLSDLYETITVADAQFPEVTLEDGRVIRATGSSAWQSLNRDRLQQDRRAIYEGYIGVFNGFDKTLARLYGAILKRNWALAKARDYDSCLKAALDQYAIPVAVYDTLIETAYKGAEPLRRYHQLRRRALGLEKYYDYDRRVPLVESSVSFSYDQIRQPLLDSVAPLGEPYQREVASFYGAQRIDVYENEGKQPRNFSLSTFGFPAFLKLNYGDTMEDAFTLAHEMGHGMHANLTRRNQIFDTYRYSTFVAETASIFNEALLHDQLLASADDPGLRIALLQYRIDTIAMAFYEIAMLADFERRAHSLVEQGKPINAEILQALYLDRYTALYQETMDDPELLRNAWTTWIHLYFKSPFYLFQYATSLAASTALHAQIAVGPEEQRAEAVNRYIKLLSAGASDHPASLLRRAGVDLTQPESLGALVDEMDQLVTRLESALANAGLLSTGEPIRD